MIAELTAEERVTKILSSYQVLEKCDNFSIENDYKNLGDFLSTAKPIDILEEMNSGKKDASEKDEVSRRRRI